MNDFIQAVLAIDHHAPEAAKGRLFARLAADDGAKIGDRVLISGVPGVPDGTYDLRPAKTRTAQGRKRQRLVAKPKPRAAKARAKGEKRDPAALAALTEKLGAYIAAHPGQRIEIIGKALGAQTKDLALPIRKLLAAGVITSKGQKRATTYAPKAPRKAKANGAPVAEAN